MLGAPPPRNVAQVTMLLSSSLLNLCKCLGSESSLHHCRRRGPGIPWKCWASDNVSRPLPGRETGRRKRLFHETPSESIAMINEMSTKPLDGGRHYPTFSISNVNQQPSTSDEQRPLPRIHLTPTADKSGCRQDPKVPRRHRPIHHKHLQSLGFRQRGVNLPFAERGTWARCRNARMATEG